MVWGLVGKPSCFCAITSTKIQITLSQAVDSAVAANFTIPGVTINSATLDASKTVVTLGVAGLVADESYTLTATGLQVNAEEQPDTEKGFTMPEVAALFTPELSFGEDVTSLKADGAASTLVTYELKDGEGNVITDVEDLEVAFTTTFGSFGEQRVAVQNGVATVMLTSEFLTVDRTAQLTATVVNAADESLIGLEANATILMTPNPEAGEDETVGASMTDAEANQSDRVILYFNKDVDVNDYLVQTAARAAELGGSIGDIDSTLATVNVRENSISATTGAPVAVKGLLPVPGNSKALQVLLDVEASANNALTDNSDVWVQFIDKTQTVSVDRSLTFKNTDVRKPSMLSVTNEGLTKLVITFSEAIINDNSVNGAEKLGNWSIDGTLLTNTTKWGAATITVGSFDQTTGEDKRNVVTIELGTGKYFASGNHSVQAANIGDWAMLTDNNNIMNTQTLDFVIPVDNDAPSATVEVQSPEQWLVTYDKDVTETANDFAAALKLQRYNTSTEAWVNADVTTYDAEGDVDNTGDSNLDVVVTKIDDNKFLVETDYDWSKVHDKEGTGENYFNHSYRLHVPANTVTNVANGLKNAEENLTLDGPMLAVDAQSPVISEDIVQVDGVGALAGVQVYEVTMSEPVKLNDTANVEGETLAQDQTDLPVPTAEFVKKDGTKTIAGRIDTSFVDDYETVVRAYAVDTDGSTPIDLEAGEWTLIVRSISDDYGNTAASVTKDFIVEGSEPVDTDFEVVWSFADVDSNWAVEDLDSDDDGVEDGIQDGVIMAADDDADYDYVVVKFNKAIATSGDFKNATKTANYTFDGEPLPTGTQILANIEGYDDLDSTIDSVTIRLPRGTLQTDNAPHNLNISRNIESADGEQLGTSGGEITLEYDNYANWDGNMADAIADDLTVYSDVLAVQTAADDILSDGFDAGEVTAFEGAYKTAAASIDALDDDSHVKAQYQAKIDELKAAVKAHDDFVFEVTDSDADDVIEATVAGIDSTSNFSVKLWDTTTDRYTITDNGPINGDTITVTAGTGTVTYSLDNNADETGTFTVTIEDAFWGVSDTVTVDVTDDDDTPANEDIVVNND